MGNKIAFLLGAGVSDPERKLGISTKELTEKILKCENIIRDYSGRYFYGQCNGLLSEDGRKYADRIKKFFLILKSYFGNHYSFFGREMNYEDYYYLVDSIHKEEWGEIENPLVTYFGETLTKTHALLFEPIIDGFYPLELIDLTRETLNYIKFLVVDTLDKKPSDLDHYNFLKDVSNDCNFEKVLVFTLNHDIFIEQFCKKESIDIQDGFIKSTNGSARIWFSESYDNDQKMKLFKLHGSINWELYKSSNPYERRICIYSEPQRDASEPQIIIGSFNKLNEYNRGIHFELQCLFWKYLNECDRLVIAGYSFGDQGINSRIINWLYKSRGRRIIIIHKDDNYLIRNARPTIESNWKEWQKNNSVTVISKWIQETNWAEIKDSLW